MKYNIANIRDNADYAREQYEIVLRRLYVDGPVSAEDMELLSFIATFQPGVFNEHKAQILYSLGLFYKDGLQPDSIYSQVMKLYAESIESVYQKAYTPIQADIIHGFNTKQYVSFSAPTSSGKSFLFMDLIKNARQDVVIVVPSRALINEYIYKLATQIQDKRVNILPFIDKINLARCEKSIYVVTPERCRELFKMDSGYAVDMFLFDEAQLTDEDEIRGLVFDSIVRRCKKYYPDAKLLFAHPFVDNPEAQIQKNSLVEEVSYAHSYKERAVGQLFVAKDGNNFSYFSINPELSRQSVSCDDPVEKALRSGGHVLIYTPKSQIYDNRIFESYERYISLCEEYHNEAVQKYVVQLQNFIGGDPNQGNTYHSKMLQLLKSGIVVHHGSLPLEARLIVERFVQEGYCRMCFATTTLEKGVNMLFDVVCMERLTRNALRLKNIIGRAGRSTKENEFNIGTIVVGQNRKSDLRSTLREEAILKSISNIETDDPLSNPEAERFRDAIKNDTFSEEYNMPERDVALLSNNRIHEHAKRILDLMFEGREIYVDGLDEDKTRVIGEQLVSIFSEYWRRNPGDGEAEVIRTANKIFIWRLLHRTFKNICHIRYAYIARLSEQRDRRNQGRGVDDLKAQRTQCFSQLPNKNRLRYVIPLFERDTPVTHVDYDKVLYDTYDYIDKIIGFYMSDRLYAVFMKYYEATNDERAKKLAKVYKYGTYDEKSIMLLRYGLSFEDIENLGQYVQSASEMGITVTDDFAQLPEETKRPLERYI